MKVKLLQIDEIWYKSFIASMLSIIMVCLSTFLVKAATPYSYQGVLSPEMGIAFTKILDEVYDRLNITPLGYPVDEFSPNMVFAACALMDFEGDNIPELFFIYPIGYDGEREMWEYEKWCYEVWQWDGTKVVCLAKENIATPNNSFYFRLKQEDGKIYFYYLNIFQDKNMKVYGIEDKKWQQVKYFQGNAFWGDLGSFGNLPPMIDGKVTSLDDYIEKSTNWLFGENTADCLDCSFGKLQERTFDRFAALNLYHQLSARYAVPSNVKLNIDGKYYTLDAFNIENSNYFKAHDIAQLMVGTSKEAYVEGGIGNEGNCYLDIARDLYSDNPQPNKYQSTGTELKRSNLKPTILNRYISENHGRCLDGFRYVTDAYVYQGYTYLSIQDLGALFDFSVKWDNSTKTILIDTTKSYE